MILIVFTKTCQTHYEVFVVNLHLIFTNCLPPPVSWGNLWLLHASLSAVAFTKINSPLPSSAAVERLFSAAAQVFTSQRCRMSDATLEQHIRSQLKLGSDEKSD